MSAREDNRPSGGRSGEGSDRSGKFAAIQRQPPQGNERAASRPDRYLGVGLVILSFGSKL
jgi:hypothetical protein